MQRRIGVSAEKRALSEQPIIVECSRGVQENAQLSHTKIGRNCDTFYIANMIFAAAGMKLLESYKSDSLNYYGSEAELLDLIGDTEGSRERINTWVEQQTNNKIKDLFPAGSLGSNSVVVLTNAIYFKGEWETKFDASWTKKGEFYLSKTKSEITDMMHMRKKICH